MKKKILVIALIVAMLALPTISIAQAKPGGIPTETFHDLTVGGSIVADYPRTRGARKYAICRIHRPL